jgi:hypothetical protein
MKKRLPIYIIANRTKLVYSPVHNQAVRDLQTKIQPDVHNNNFISKALI